MIISFKNGDYGNIHNESVTGVKPAPGQQKVRERRSGALEMTDQIEEMKQIGKKENERGK